MSDARQAKTLDEACRNPDGTYSAIRLLSWLSEAVAPGKGIAEDEVRQMAAEAMQKQKGKQP